MNLKLNHFDSPITNIRSEYKFAISSVQLDEGTKIWVSSAYTHGVVDFKFSSQAYHSYAIESKAGPI